MAEWRLGGRGTCYFSLLPWMVEGSPGATDWTNTARLTTVYRNQHVIYICCGFGLVMSGVNLSGVIGRLSIYCKPTCTRVFIFGDRGEEWVG